MPDTTLDPALNENSSESHLNEVANAGLANDCAAAWRLLNEYTQSASLLKHALGVEICVRAHGEQRAVELGLSPEQARTLVETYSITGLLHDFDYEKYPSREEHPWVGNRILTEQGWPERYAMPFWRTHITPIRRVSRISIRPCLPVMSWQGS